VRSWGDGATGRSRWRRGWLGPVDASRPFVRYGFALAAAASTVSLKLALDAVIGTQIPFSVVVVPLVLVAWFAGFGPGQVASLLVAAAAQYFPLSTDYSLAQDPDARLWLTVFIGYMTVLNWLTASRKRALRQLHTVGQLYRALAENIAQLAWILDRNGGLHYANRRLFDYTGMPCHSLLGRGWEAVLHPGDRTAARARWAENLQTGETFEMRQRLRRADGGYRWFLVRAVPVRDENGQITDWFGTATDIDADVHAEEAHARLAAIVESANDAIIGTTVNGTVTNWNKAAEEIYGYRADEMIGRSIAVVVPPDHFEEHRHLNERVTRGEKIVRLETLAARKDGRLIPISLTLSPIVSSDGVNIGISRIVRDITERKRMEQTLRESERRFRIVADAAPVMIWMTDPSGQWTFRNKTYLEFVGGSTEAAAGRLDYAHEADREFYWQTFSAALNDRRPYLVEYRIKRGDGQYRWVVESGVPHFAPDGSLAGYIGSAVDVTERKWIEQSLRGAFDELEIQVAQQDHALAETTQRLRHEITKRIEAEKTLQHIVRQN
jgi:PAS domain S-box-containing protein